jgi:bacteriocin-like protein
MTATINTAATSKQVREPTQELSEDELNAVAGGRPGAQSLQGGGGPMGMMNQIMQTVQTLQGQG